MATYEDIQRANAEIVTTNIRGKEYADVAQRVSAFRKVYPQGTIRTEMVSVEGQPGRAVAVFRAVVSVGENVLGTGTAYEIENAGNINRTSFIENCETSAVGRALGFAGFGIAGSIASADEVARVTGPESAQEGRVASEAHTTAKQHAESAKRVTEAEAQRLEKLVKNNGLSVAALLRTYHVTHVMDLTPEQAREATEKTLAWAKKNQQAMKEGAEE